MNQSLRARICIIVLSSISVLQAAAPIKNSFRTELEEVLQEHDAATLTAQPHDHIDKYCLDILETAAGKNVPIIRATATDFPQLYDAVTRSCTGYNMPTPRIFIALDDSGIDVKFCTYDRDGGMLLHRKTFDIFSTRVFRGYLEQVLLRMNKHFSHHASLRSQQQQQQRMSAGAVGTANLLLLVLARSLSDEQYIGTAANLLQLAAAAASGVWLYKLFTQRMTTHSFQRVSSFHNEEQAREDVFPGKTPEESLEPTFNAPATHMLEVIAQTQAFIRQRDKEFADLQKWEDEEILERTRQAALQASQAMSPTDLQDDLPSR